jgi:hypothetical protein
MAFIRQCETVDPDGVAWGEYLRLGPTDQRDLDAILTPHAFRALIRSEKSFDHMFPIFSQSFSRLPIFVLKPRGIAPLEGTSARERYRLCFTLIQHMVWRNKELIGNGVMDQSEFINMSVAFLRESGGTNKITGYTTYCRYTDPTTIGEVNSFLYFSLARVVTVGSAGAGLCILPRGPAQGGAGRRSGRGAQKGRHCVCGQKGNRPAIRQGVQLVRAGR